MSRSTMNALSLRGRSARTKYSSDAILPASGYFSGPLWGVRSLHAMTDSVQIYVNDHLAGTAHAMSLLAHLESKHPSDPVGLFASKLLAEVKSDYETLQGIAIRIDAGSSALKESGARLSERICRFKLDDHGAISFETFECLEFMVLGIHGKRERFDIRARRRGTGLPSRPSDVREFGLHFIKKRWRIRPVGRRNLFS